jgi:hypothetical protein
MTAIAPTGTAWYAYAVIPAGLALPDAAAILPDAPLEALRCGGVAVLASPVPRGLFDAADPANRSGDPDWVAARAQAHHAVVAATEPCLPFAFGTLFTAPAPILDWLAPRQAALAAALAAIAGQAEWTVTLVEDQAAHGAWAAAHDPAVTALAARVAALPEGAAFLLGRRLAQAVPAARDAHRQAVLARLDAVLAASGQARLPEARPGARTLLAGPTAIAALRPGLEALADDLAGTGLGLDLSGPWPAYAYARLALEGAAA